MASFGSSKNTFAAGVEVLDEMFRTIYLHSILSIKTSQP